MTKKDWKQFVPFYFYTPLALGLGGAAIMSKTRSFGGILLLCLTGVVTWGLIEYCLHRFVFHFDAQSEKGHARVYAMHLSHHAQPKALEDLFTGLQLSLPIALCYCALAWAITRSWQAMVYLFIGLMAGYFSYEFLHYHAHHHRPRGRLLRYLKKYHMLHHHQTPALRFGVTSPVFDYLFGTFRPTQKIAAKIREV
jgi:sterol desaturase/sphingolipid hydroxylase (fatty acid hydroxylase superfamily)